jgi:hypothetical protein
MPKVTIRVTKEDIETGRRGACGFCPIAFAVRRETNCHDVWVYDLTIDIKQHEHGQIAEYRTPFDAQRFMLDFDDGLAVKPFEFEMEPVY